MHSSRHAEACEFCKLVKAVKKREEEKCEEEKREEAPHFKYKSSEEKEMVSELAEEMQYFNRKFAEALNRLSSCELCEGGEGGSNGECVRVPESVKGWSLKLRGILSESLEQIKDGGGKRIRPIICILSAEAVGGDREDAIDVAIAIELLHNASLIHDDILDNNVMRRKKPSNPAMFGEKKAIIVGDFLFGLSCMFLAACGVPSVVEKVSEAVAETSAGECIEFLRRESEKSDEHSYFEVVSLKTASVFRASAEAGAILGGGDDASIQHLRAFGLNLGIAYQIQDDILDIFGDPAETGKPLCLDIMNGERTILLMHAMRHANAEERAFLASLRGKEISEADIKRVQRIMIERGSVEYAFRISERFLHAACEHLQNLRPPRTEKERKARRKLSLVADLSVKRLEKQLSAAVGGCF